MNSNFSEPERVLIIGFDRLFYIDSKERKMSRKFEDDNKENDKNQRRRVTLSPSIFDEEQPTTHTREEMIAITLCKDEEVAEEEEQPIVISLDGNIGAGKSTLLEAVRKALPDVEVVVEPVGEWLTLKNAEGKSLLELFYDDKRRWAYTFQNLTILSRLRAIREVLASTKKKVIIMERSVLTDRFVFAEMLKGSVDK